MSAKVAHLEMIQKIIERQANNSLHIKIWAMAVFTAFIVLPSGEYILAGIIPIAVFWYLDSRYLAQEKAFRNLYNDVRKKEESEIDFSMDTKTVRAGPVMGTWSEYIMYLTLAATVVFISAMRTVV